MQLKDDSTMEGNSDSLNLVAWVRMWKTNLIKGTRIERVVNCALRMLVKLVLTVVKQVTFVNLYIRLLDNMA